MRTSVRAIIIQNNNILLIHRVKNNKEYWVFPGGGLEETDSSQEEGLKRECIEELGVDVQVGKFIKQRMYDENQVDLFYECNIVGGVVGTGKGPEYDRDVSISGVYKVEWIQIKDLSRMNVFPVEIRDLVIENYGQ